LTNKASLENVKIKWLPEINANSPNTPFILVGLDIDKRNEWASPSNVTYV